MATSIIKHTADIGGAKYTKQADGTLTCWGTDTIPNGSYSKVVNFPVSFANTSYVATITFIINDASVHNVTANGKYPNGMNVNRNGNTGAHTFDWIAIGRWK